MVRIGYDAPVLNSPTITGLPEVGTTSADVAPHSRRSMAAAWAPRSMSALCAGSMLTVGISTMWPRRSSKRPRTFWVYESSLRGSGVDPFIGPPSDFGPRESTTGGARRLQRSAGSLGGRERGAQRLATHPRGPVAGRARHHDHRIPLGEDGPIGRGGQRVFEFARVLLRVPDGGEDRDAVVTAAVVLPEIAPPARDRRVGPAARVLQGHRIEHVDVRPGEDRQEQLAELSLPLERPAFAQNGREIGKRDRPGKVLLRGIPVFLGVEHLLPGNRRVVEGAIQIGPGSDVLRNGGDVPPQQESHSE